jgi:hypothetical protein
MNRFPTSPTEAEFRSSDLMLAFSAGAASMGFAILLVIVFALGPL